MKAYFIRLYRLYEARENSDAAQERWESAISAFSAAVILICGAVGLITWGLITETTDVLLAFGALFSIILVFKILTLLPVYIGKHFAAKEEN